MYRIIANNSNLHCVWGFLISQCLVMQYSLALQSLCWERKDWLFALLSSGGHGICRFLNNFFMVSWIGLWFVSMALSSHTRNIFFSALENVI